MTPVKTVALWSGIVTTDSGGHATVKLPAADFNGQLRIMAVAWTDNQVGAGDKELTVREPVIADLSLPRFLSPGDKPLATLELQDMEGKPGAYTVVMRAAGGIVAAFREVFQLILGQRLAPHIPFNAPDHTGVGSVGFTVTGPGFSTSKDYPIENSAGLGTDHPLHHRTAAAGRDLHASAGAGQRPRRRIRRHAAGAGELLAVQGLRSWPDRGVAGRLPLWLHRAAGLHRLSAALRPAGIQRSEAALRSGRAERHRRPAAGPAEPGRRVRALARGRRRGRSVAGGLRHRLHARGQGRGRARPAERHRLGAERHAPGQPAGRRRLGVLPAQLSGLVGWRAGRLQGRDGPHALPRLGLRPLRPRQGWSRRPGSLTLVARRADVAGGLAAGDGAGRRGPGHDGRPGAGQGRLAARRRRDRLQASAAADRPDHLRRRGGLVSDAAARPRRRHRPGLRGGHARHRPRPRGATRRRGEGPGPAQHPGEGLAAARRPRHARRIGADEYPGRWRGGLHAGGRPHPTLGGERPPARRPLRQRRAASPSGAPSPSAARRSSRQTPRRTGWRCRRASSPTPAGR